MGCFLACFGTSKEEKRRNQKKHKLPIHQQSYGIPKSLEHHTQSQETAILADPSNVNFNADNSDGLEKVIAPDHFNADLNTHLPDGLEKVISADSPNLDLNTDLLDDGLEEESILITRKKVTFDTNVKTYEPILVHDSAELFIENENNPNDEKDNSLENSSLLLSNSCSEDDSITSSVGSYAPNHRYQNCRDSDDETDDFDCEDSDAYDENHDTEEYNDLDEDENEILVEKVWAESVPTASMESRTEISSGLSVVDEVDSPLVVTMLAENERNNYNLNRNARNRSVYQPVLNPVENIAQWKAAKAKTTSSVKPQKENFAKKQEESRLSFSFMSKSDQTENKDQEISVDASRSSWLSTPVKKSSHAQIKTERSSYSDRSYSPTNLIEDRPILGALTVEEIKQFSASNSPRKSPSRSPDEMAIIGSVGRYWNSSGSTEDRSSISSSYKGIPNSTSKYTEDKKVIWHSTPFETRLERALKRGDNES